MKLRTLGLYAILTVIGVILIYPLIWMFFGSFKTTMEILTSIRLFPSKFILEGYKLGWEGSGQFTFGHFMRNTFTMVVPTVVFTSFSSIIVAYGFARFRFPLNKLLFAMMLATLMLPPTVVIIPRYLLFQNLGFLDTYLPFIVPAILGGSPFYIFMQYQFLRGLPKELDESAVMDGANSFIILTRILLPLSVPAMISAALFNFMWAWNEFFSVLIYISSVEKYTVSLALRMMMDIDAATTWNQIMAMSVVSMLPCLLFFFFAQRFFVEGIAKTGIKG
ncbi:carbohydrate ABC transporter permease [Paenibacillus athensensis]|uniref:Sugar ABC transporter permease n=1 Tax=Paenibacillus athensensis TaxID=1967502 RepID=A0A4Y8Q265_9BACL|nr:carbohydrate ABC transporter permease [Paenibacillus athensensis]MCD1261393.1 carbohydrate ABC transporter permease [Paenibacillus athensensis]